MATITNNAVNFNGLGQLENPNNGPRKSPVRNSPESNRGISIAKKEQLNIDLDFIRQLGPHVKVTVQEGDTLEKLLMDQGYSRHEIYDKGILDQVVRENKLKDPNCIPVGTEISLPTKHPKIKGSILDPNPKPQPITFPPKQPWWEKGNEM